MKEKEDTMQKMTLTLLDDLNNVIAVHLFQEADHHVNRQRCVSGRDDPISDQSQGRISVVVKILDLVALVTLMKPTNIPL